MRGVIVVLAIPTALWGCQEYATTPKDVASYAITEGAPSSVCPATATFTVSDESSLRSALAQAGPGTVIAVRGMIGVTADLFVTTENVRLTCATPGSGLVALAGNPDFLFLIQALASGDVVDNLVLDGSVLPEGPYFGSAPNLRLVSNSATCPPNGECPFFDAAPGAIVTDNRFTAIGSGTGLHMQNGIDGSRIERNTIIATAPSTVSIFGGIRARDGRDVVIADNAIIGPWLNSMSLTFLNDSRIERNDLTGAPLNGILLGLPGSFRLVGLRGNVFRNNRASAAGSTDLRVAQACSNVFVGNSLQSTASGVTVFFDTTSGGNTFIGNSTAAIDLGSQDCNEDGIVDPNILTGITIARGNVPGMAVSAAMRRLQ
jgi:hypothetical protein